MNNMDWLDESIGDYEDDYIVIDCPGQIELYTHIPVLPRVAKHLQMHFGFRMCAVYLLESAFIVDRTKFLAGVMSAMSAMLLLEMPHINVLSKVDLIRKQIRRRELKKFLDPDAADILREVNSETNPKFHLLNESLVQLVRKVQVLKRKWAC